MSLIYEYNRYEGINRMKDDSRILTTQSKELNQDIIDSWGNQKKYFIKQNFILIEWEEAKSLLRKGNISGGKQYHTGWLTIFTKDDKSYLTTQPKLDEVWNFIKENSLKIDGFCTE